MTLSALVWSASCAPATLTSSVQVATVLASTSNPPPGSSMEPGGACDYAYFPTEEDTSWEYAVSSSGVGEFRQTTTITEARDDGFTATSRYSHDDAVLVLEYACTEAGLVLLDPANQLMGGTATGAAGKAVLKTLSASGITPPGEMEPGQAWQQFVEWQVSSADTTLRGDWTADYSAVGLEMVSVPFGDFDAMHVETESRGTLEGEEFGGLCRNSSWYAKHVGMIKGISSCGGVDTVTELESYDSP